MPVAFAASPHRVTSADKNSKNASDNKRAIPVGTKAKLRSTSESSSFAQNGSRAKTKKVTEEEKDALNTNDNSIEPRKEAARRHRAKLGNRSYSDSHALHEEVLRLYDTEVEVFVVRDETKLRGILKQSSSTASSDYSLNLRDSYELSACLELLYADTVVIESEDSLLSSASSSLDNNKNSSSDDMLNGDVDGEDVGVSAEKRVRFAAKPQLQLYRQNASIAGRTHKNQKKKLAKKKKKNGDSPSDHDDDSNRPPNDCGRKRTSSGGSDSGVNMELSSSLSSVNDMRDFELSMPNDDDDLDDDAVMQADDEQHATPNSTSDVDFVHRALNLLGLGGNSSSALAIPTGNDKVVSGAEKSNAGVVEKNATDLTVNANGICSRKRRRRRTRSSCQ